MEVFLLTSGSSLFQYYFMLLVSIATISPSTAVVAFNGLQWTVTQVDSFLPVASIIAVINWEF